MPPVPGKANEYFFDLIKTMQKRITALETKQNFAIRDAKNILRLRAGLLPDGTFGMQVFDTAGNPRVGFGQLPDGDSGMAVYSQANDGTYVEVNPPVASAASGTLSTASTSPTTLAGSPTLPVTVGASGKALIILSGTIGLSASSTVQQGVAQLYVDGAANGPRVEASLTLNTVAGGLQATGGLPALVSGLSQGAHTLSIEYQSVYGASINFSFMQITAIPY